VRHLLLNVGAQPVNRSRREANGRELTLHFFTQACEGSRALAFPHVGKRYLVE
jgi:hypothetical protein